MKKFGEKFLEAYDVYASAILRHIYFRVNNKELAKDLTQETFFKAWRHLASGEEEIKNFRAFFYRIANNLIIDHYRRKAKETIPLEDIETKKEVVYEAEQEKQVQNLMDKSLIEKYLAELDEEQRQILLYRYVDDLSIEEISELTEKSPNNISVIIYRAIKILKEKVKNVRKT